MKAGVSSASLYPMHTEDAVRTLCELGVKHTEIFVNDISETRGAVFDEIKSIARSFELDVVSVHPFSTPMETLFMFSDYDRRRETFFDMYRSYFDFAERMGARIFVLHGAAKEARCSDSMYFEQFLRLCDIASEYGLTVAQENISYCRSADIDFLKRMMKECGDRAKFVLDIKQAVRSGISPFELLYVLGRSMIHVHISDNMPGKDCLPPGKGSFDLSGLIKKLSEIKFDGAVLTELYRSNYGEPSELYDSMVYIENIIQNVEKCDVK